MSAEIAEANLEELLKPTQDSLDDLQLTRVTCGTLSLCQFAKLSILDGDEDAELYDILAFLFIHSEKRDTVRQLLFADGDAFREAVLDFGDRFAFEDFQKLSEKVTGMLTNATEGMVEVDELALEAQEGQPQKKTNGQE